MSDVASDPPTSTGVWWYVIVLTPMVASLIAIVGIAIGTTATLTATADLSLYLPAYFALAGMALPLIVLYPLAMYRDATHVAAQDLGWTPEPDRYLIAAIVSVATLFMMAMPLSWYYLQKRHHALEQRANLT